MNKREKEIKTMLLENRYEEYLHNKTKENVELWFKEIRGENNV